MGVGSWGVQRLAALQQDVASLQVKLNGTLRQLETEQQVPPHLGPSGQCMTEIGTPFPLLHDCEDCIHMRD